MAAVTVLLSGCVSHMVSGGKNPALAGQVPEGTNYSVQKQYLPTVKPFPLKIANREALYDKTLKDSLEQYFQKRGDFPEVKFMVRPAMPLMDDGFSGGYLAFRWDYNFEADVMLTDWENTSDLIFEFTAKTAVSATTKTPIGGSPDTMRIINTVNEIGNNNLAADIVGKLEARRGEIEKLAARYSSWKSNR